jgi:hypothetical protein
MHARRVDYTMVSIDALVQLGIHRYHRRCIVDIGAEPAEGGPREGFFSGTRKLLTIWA